MKPSIIEETSRGTQFINIESSMMRNREIFLTDPLNTESCSDLLKQLMYLEKDAPGEPVILYISCPGGEVVSAMAVYDYIRMMRSPVYTVCIGTAASMGAILFLAGEKRKMLPHSRIMIHDPSFSQLNIGGMKPHEIQEMVDSLKDIKVMLAGIIAERTGMDNKTVREITKQDTYYSAEEAVESGIATEIIRAL